MGFYDFNKDLEASHNSVKRVCDVIKEKGGEIIELGDTKDYDIRFSINGKEYLAEVKEDLMSSKTGNVAIEYQSRGKESGILSSKSSIWAYIIKGEIYFANRLKILALLCENDFRLVYGGDNKTSKLYLVPIDKFIHICKQ